MRYCNNRKCPRWKYRIVTANDDKVIDDRARIIGYCGCKGQTIDGFCYRCGGL